uniref:Uncharacterized protein n=1 Tax=Athene cunicularia TaxID=194338 RepID=A0A663M1D2_ATHCN
MHVVSPQENIKYFEKRGKKEVCPILDQFLCHVLKGAVIRAPCQG